MFCGDANLYPPPETVSQLLFLSFRASEARRRACPVLDTGESRNINIFWIPAFETVSQCHCEGMK
jgi:hypothetical protein